MPKWPIWGGERPVEGAGIAELEAGAALAVERHIDHKQFAVLALVQLAHHDGHAGLCRLASASRCLAAQQPVSAGRQGWNQRRDQSWHATPRAKRKTENERNPEQLSRTMCSIGALPGAHLWGGPSPSSNSISAPGDIQYSHTSKDIASSKGMACSKEMACKYWLQADTAMNSVTVHSLP
jgi:hypothetical protein